MGEGWEGVWETLISGLPPGSLPHKGRVPTGGSVARTQRRTMADIAHSPDLSPASQTLLRHYRGQVLTRRVYSVIGVVLVLIALGAAMNFANAANSGKFFERIPYLFDFRSEEHTSELQSQSNLVCRHLLEKKNRRTKRHAPIA